MTQQDTITTAAHQPPFPWFGGKSRAAELIWSRIGNVANYIEPFAGSLAILMLRPHDPGTETINDADRYVANFWRAVQADPVGVADSADWPVNETDLEARHQWLITEGAARLVKLLTDPDAFDAKIAGWWVWGQCAWIGSGWCSGEGPWRVDGGEWLRNAGKGVNRQLPHLGNAGQGVNRQLPHLRNAGQGVNRKLPHLGDAGQGVNRKLPHLRNAGQGVNRKLPHLRNAGQGTRERHHEHLIFYMQSLADRLRYARITCGDWRRVLTPSVTFRHGTTGIVLDPPYGTGEVNYSAGGNRCEGIAAETRQWAIENASNPDLRIALCGYDGQFEMPRDWIVEEWKAAGGYSSTAEGDTQGKENRHRERVWFSPSCVETASQGVLNFNGAA